MRTLVDRSKEATERLTKDSAIWSRSFRRQAPASDAMCVQVWPGIWRGDEMKDIVMIR